MFTVDGTGCVVIVGVTTVPGVVIFATTEYVAFGARGSIVFVVCATGSVVVAFGAIYHVVVGIVDRGTVVFAPGTTSAVNVALGVRG